MQVLLTIFPAAGEHHEKFPSQEAVKHKRTNSDIETVPWPTHATLVHGVTMGLPWGYHGVTMVTKALVDICEQEREKAKQHFELEVKDLMGSLVWVNHGKSA